ncbi:MAG TPA: tetratricopeptide repeat protein [Candidatus Dormibacteraeota bacterium]|nr:tetratricopeptide repeat protein [Candidatus Dormibacteraeota bacterium]
MGAVDPRTALLTCASQPDGDIAAGALWMAAEDCEDVDVDARLAEIDALGDEVRARGGGAVGSLSDVAAAELIGAVLDERLGLHGGAGGDPQNHYLHTVMRRGEGIPIACAALWIAAGRRATLGVEGVGLPGHFVVRVGSLLVDPHSGGTPLDDEGARRVAATGLGGRIPESLPPAWTRRATAREMLARMSRNLRQCHAAGERWSLALQAADRCVALDPLEPLDRRDRGLLRFRVGLALPALRDLRTYLNAVPDAPDHADVSRVAARAMGMVN